MTLDIIRSLPDKTGCYVLMDSWYSNFDVFDACREKGRHLIGAMKTNRILYPEGRRTSAADLAASLDPGCFHPVTVKGRAYMVYRYEGPLNKIDHAVVLLSYPASAIDRLLLVIALAHFFFSCGLGRFVSFLIGLRICRAAFLNF